MGKTRTNGSTSVLQEVGDSGLGGQKSRHVQHTGWLRDDPLKEWQGQKKFDNIDKMRLYSPIVGAGLAALSQPIKRVKWFYTSDQGDDDPRLDLLNDSMSGLSTPWRQHINEVLTMLPFGFTPFTINYKQEANGRYLWRKFKMLGQDTIYMWLMDEGGGLQGLRQKPHIWKDPIHIERVILFRVNVERNNPEGRSMLRQAWIPYYFAWELQKFEAIGEERGLAGIPVMTMPENASYNLGDEDNPNTDAGWAMQIVRNLRIDEQAGVVKPPGWELELLSTGATRVFNTNQIIQRYESRILMSLLAQSLILGLNNVGTQSKAETDMDLMTLAMEGIADNIADTHTRIAIPRLMALNGLKADGLKLEHSPVSDIGLDVLGQFLTQVGQFINLTPEDEVMIRGMARLPEKSVEEIESVRESLLPTLPELTDEFIARNQPGGAIGAAHYQSDVPDERQRNRYERQWQKQMSEFLQKQKRRVLRKAKELQ